ncbi:MAG: XrtA/PEP-CTERM system histidine kinase PrsK [Pseudomonadota bacterium]
MTANISLLTHGLAAVAYGLLAVLLLTQWRVRPLGPALVFAASASAIWATLIAAGTLHLYPPITAIQVAELARDSGWIFFLLQLLGLQEDDDPWRWLGLRWPPLFAAALLLAGALMALRPLAPVFQLSRTVGTDIALILWLGLSVMGLLLVEQVYRNASSTERWGVKFLCLGLGALFAYDFFMYAEALLFRALNPQLWQARGLVAALVTPWLLIAVIRNQNWRMDVHMSRHVVFHSVTLIGAGLYLLAMAVIGYFIKYLGGSWGGVIQIGFLAASGALLFTLLFSGTLRARLRVLLSKHFFSYRYDYREEWLRFTERLGALREVPAGIVSTMAEIALSPGGFILWRDDRNALVNTASWEFDAPVIDDLGNMEEWISETGWVIDVREWRNSPDHYRDFEPPPWLHNHKSIWLVIPLIFQDQLEGLLFLARTDLKHTVNWEDRDLLKTAGRQAGALLAQERVRSALVEARQFDAFNRLSAYVIHDLKNILAQQSLIVANAQKHRSNPAFVDDMITTIENSVNRMQRLMNQMRSGLREGEAIAVSLGPLLEQAIEARAGARPLPTLVTSGRADVVADRERLSTVFSHLLQNAQEATSDDGEVGVRIKAEGGSVSVSIRDTGAGMSASFIRERLFKPFESTKGLTGMGIGAFESREYVRQLGGDIRVESEVGAGSVFTVTLPLVTAGQNRISQACDPHTPAEATDMAH